MLPILARIDSSLHVLLQYLYGIKSKELGSFNCSTDNNKNLHTRYILIRKKRITAKEKGNCLNKGLIHTETVPKKGTVKMKHTRIRTFNTKKTYPEQNLDNDLCQAVVARGSTVFLRGQIGQNLDTSENVCIGDAAGQAEQAMYNIDMLLKEVGGELEDICKITIYIIDPRYREDVYRVVGKWLKGVFPVSTGIVVSALARPEWLVEIDATAVIPD